MYNLLFIKYSKGVIMIREAIKTVDISERRVPSQDLSGIKSSLVKKFKEYSSILCKFK